MSIRQLLYVSNTRTNLNDSDLNAILESARRNNRAHQITGMLLYLEGAFLQVLEGPDHEVGAVYDRIARDQRHWDTQILLDRQAQRAFGEWSMGFERLDGPTPDGAFAVTLDRVMGKIDPESLKDLPALVATFCRIHRGGGHGLE